MVTLGFVKSVLMHEQLHLHKIDDERLQELFDALKISREGDPASKDNDEIMPETRVALQSLLRYAKNTYSLAFPYKL